MPADFTCEIYSVTCLIWLRLWPTCCPNSRCLERLTFQKVSWPGPAFQHWVGGKDNHSCTIWTSFWLQYIFRHQYYSSFVLCRSVYASVSGPLLFLCLCPRFCLSVSFPVSISVLICLCLFVCLSVFLLLFLFGLLWRCCAFFCFCCCLWINCFLLVSSSWMLLLVLLVLRLCFCSCSIACFWKSTGFDSALTVPWQCPDSALTVPRHSARWDSL